MNNLRKALNNLKTSRLFPIFVILAAIPVTVLLVQVSQELRERAAGGPASLSILPATQTKSVGEVGQVGVYLDPGGANVSSVELVITYDPNVIDVTNILPGPFFTDPAPDIGDPIIITKDLGTPGRIHYALGFPLGSGFSSTATLDVALIDFTGKSDGATSLDFDVSSQPSTIVSDINAQDVLGNAVSGMVNVSGGSRLYFSGPTPPNPQAVSGTFTLDVMADTAGQQVDAVDARIVFDPSVLAVTAVSEGTEPAFVSFPGLDFDNSAGTAIISANIGSGASPTPAQGSALHVGTLTFQVNAVSASSKVSFDFTPGGRNDSNMVLSGTWQTQDPLDILASVTDVDIVIGTGPTVTPTPIPPPPPPPIPANSVGWVDDAPPAGAITSGSDPWTWVSTDPTPISGALALKSRLASGMHQQFFHSATETLSVNVGETMVAYVYLDPNNPPVTVALQWNDGSWEHRAYWGQNSLPLTWGVNGSASRLFMGPLPPLGQWVRLDVPASAVGLEGSTLNGMAFTLVNGQATWDYAGKIGVTGPTPTPSLSPTPTPSPTPIPSPSPTPIPTDPVGPNVAPNTTVTVSTRFSSAYAGTKAVDGIIGLNDVGEWASKGETNPWIQLDWTSPVTINFIRLYDRVNPVDHSEGGTLSFSDGSSINISGIPNDGTVFSLPFSERTVSWVRFDISGAPGSKNNGLSEFEVFSSVATSNNTAVKLGFEGILRGGVSKSKNVEFSYRKVGDTQVTTLSLVTDDDGVAVIDLIPGSYVLLFDTDGYLARSYGEDANPVVVQAGSILDLSSSPLLGGDFNNDGEVNEVDYTNNFLPAFLGTSALVDLDGSGEVNNLDFAVIRANWSLVDDSI